MITIILFIKSEFDILYDQQDKMVTYHLGGWEFNSGPTPVFQELRPGLLNPILQLSD